METLFGNSQSWRPVAIVEVPEGTDNFLQLVRDSTLPFRAEPTPQAPAGFRWYQISVESDVGDRIAQTAWAVLSALQDASDKGFLEGLRIVNGRHWLAIGSHNSGISLSRAAPATL
ncbi:MAG: hypothetical protein ACREPX_11395 [Rhodanobacteraceae bacterium]